jgi:RNA polymerase sigma-32 factor
MDNTLKHITCEAKKAHFLCQEKEQELLEKYQKTGDQKSFEQLVESHMPLVISIARKCNHYKMDLTDMIQEGSLGLMNAINKFDPSKKARLSTYAAWHIKAYIMEFILKNWSIVKVPMSNIQRKLFQKGSEYLSLEMGSRFVREKVEDILQCEFSSEIEQICVHLTTHDKYLSDHDSHDKIPLEEKLSSPSPDSEEITLRKDWCEKIKDIVETTQTLSPRQREAVLNKYFNKEHVVLEAKEMAEMMDFTTARSNFIIKRACKNLQQDKRLRQIAA